MIFSVKLAASFLSSAAVRRKNGMGVEAEGGGGTGDATDSFCKHEGFVLVLLTLTNKAAAKLNLGERMFMS